MTAWTAGAEVGTVVNGSDNFANAAALITIIIIRVQSQISQQSKLKINNEKCCRQRLVPVGLQSNETKQSPNHILAYVKLDKNSNILSDRKSKMAFLLS